MPTEFLPVKGCSKSHCLERMIGLNPTTGCDLGLRDAWQKFSVLTTIKLRLKEIILDLYISKKSF